MSMEFKILKKFTPDELIFNEFETRDILSFFFPDRISQIRTLKIDDKIREFAQGLLVEAVDASYALGFIQIIFETFFFKPEPKLSKMLKKLVKKSAKHWFKHMKSQDLSKIKIYEIVRKQIQRSFETHFILLIQGVVSKKGNASAFVNYAMINTKECIAWG